MRPRLLVLLLLALFSCSGENRVVVAAGTTLVDSGLIDRVAAEYEDQTGGRVSVVGEATPRVLGLGRRGEADLLLTHDPKQESDFRRQGLSSRYERLFASRFLVVGPVALVAEIEGLAPAQAFAAIAERGWPFVSRGDGSGTHGAELDLWEEAGIDPASLAHYEQTGQGMGLTLQVADQRGAFTLAEEATLLAAKAVLLVPVGGGGIPNPYSAILVRGSGPEAAAFLDWLVSPAGTDAVEAANEALFGDQILAPPGPARFEE